MSDSVYTAQDRANEGCCWTYYRDHCPGGGCLCDCHATNEEILLSDRARLRREVDRERRAFAELTTASVARIEQLTARAEAAEQQAVRLRAYAMALRGDLVAVDAHGTEDVDVYRHMRGTLDEDVAALAASQPAPAVETNDGLCSHCGCCSGFDQPDGSVVCIGRCDVPEQHAELARGGQADGEG